MLNDESGNQQGIARLASDLRSVKIELLSAQCAADRLRHLYSVADIVSFGERHALKGAIASAGALCRYFSSIEDRLKQVEGARITSRVTDPASFETDFLLFLHPDELAGGGIHCNCQLGIVAIRSIDDMPDQLVGIVVPVTNENRRSGWIFFQNLVPAVFLRYVKCLIGINLEEGYVKNLCRGIGRVIHILVARGNTSGGSVGSIAAGPDEGFDSVYGGRGEAGAPHGRFAIVTVCIGCGDGLYTERLGIDGIIAGGDEDLLKGGASGEQFGPLGLRLGLRRFGGVGVAGREKRENHE